MLRTLMSKLFVSSSTWYVSLLAFAVIHRLSRRLLSVCRRHLHRFKKARSRSEPENGPSNAHHHFNDPRVHMLLDLFFSLLRVIFFLICRFFLSVNESLATGVLQRGIHIRCRHVLCVTYFSLSLSGTRENAGCRVQCAACHLE